MLSLSFIVLIVSIILIAHSLFTLFWMIYAWEDPEEVKKFNSPKEFEAPSNSFTALIPARHEEQVIEDTIRAVDSIAYPEYLKETLVLVRGDDVKTMKKAKEVIEKIGKPNIRLVTFYDYPINKPHSLNIGLSETKNEIVAIFDAEDEPNKDIYNVVNTIIQKENVDVVQGGVQLMNYRSHWFSALNVLEYYFWFKSGLHFFSRLGKVTPLGGNTVFFKKNYLNAVRGWDENCLTEDAEIAVRLASAGAKVRVVYDEKHTTREETPHNVSSFVKQRTRWNQGFLQIYFKGDWLNLKTLRQKLTMTYVLLAPELQTLLLMYIPLGLIIALSEKLPIGISLISFIPFYILILQLVIFMIGLYEFTKEYKLKFSIVDITRIIFSFYPYQLLLSFSAIRALQRYATDQNGWEKTYHNNEHRNLKYQLISQYAKTY